VGEIYFYGYGGLDIDEEMAVKLYTVAADKGNADGQFNLGRMYNRGKGVNQDDAEAVRLYSLAAAQGHADAQYMLGLRFEHGQGVTKNENEAVRLYRLAAAQGHKLAPGHAERLVLQRVGFGNDRLL
jgi:TPR repeat protein